MELINELITPFKENKEIDIEMFNKLIEQSNENKNNYQLVFSNFCDGLLISLEEKIALINSIKIKNLSHIIFFFQLENEEKDIKVINYLLNSEIEYILINPPLGYTYSQNGLFLYTKNIIKKLKNKKIILANSSLTTNINFHFQTLKKLIKIFPNIIGLYENGIDYSLISLLKINFPNFKIYLNESLIEYSLDHKIDGIISLNSLIFGNDYQTIIEDYNNNFKNLLLISYLVFVHEILSFSNNSTLIKVYLKQLGYKSMNVRLPLIIEQADIDNLELLLS